MASAASNFALTEAGGLIFNAEADGGGCTEFFVGVRSGAAQAAQVHIDGLHRDGEFLAIPKGASLTFKVAQFGIRRVLARGEGGATTIDFGVVSKATGD